MLSRDKVLGTNWGTICTLVEMEAADGRKRKIQAADAEEILRIIQSIPSNILYNCPGVLQWFLLVGRLLKKEH